MGLCAYCGLHKHLCNSHAIPDGAFRVARMHTGALLEFVDDDLTENKMTQSSWQAPLLCAACERHFARRWDEFGMKALQGKLPSVEGRPARPPEATTHGVNFHDLDQGRLLKFFVSILWRASLLRERLAVPSCLEPAPL